MDAGDECQHDGAVNRKRDVVIPLLLSSVAFAVGGAFMKPSVGFTRLLPSGIVLSCFLVGAVGMTLAVQRGSLGRTYLVGLGLEAVAAVAIGVVVLGERLDTAQTAGIALVISGLMLVRL